MIANMVRAAMVVALTALAARPALAADAAPDTGTEIHLTQLATRTMAPDRLHAELRIESRGNVGRQVQADINKRMAAALDKAKSVPGVKAQTGSYSVYRDFEKKDRAVWQASQTLTLTSGDFDAVLSLAGDLQDAGLLMSGLQFSVAPETLKAAETELTTQALAGLKTRADAVAKDLGLALDHYKSITIGNAGAPVPMMRAYSAAPSASAAPAPPPVAQPGDATVSVTVNAVIMLGPPKS